MKIDPVYLELSFEKAGIRNSQKRLKGLIGELAAEPLKVHQDALNGEFALNAREWGFFAQNCRLYTRILAS